MANELEIVVHGAGGRRLYYGEVTLASGTGTLSTTLSAVRGCVLTQKDATAVADGVSWSATGGVVTVDSSNGSSAETYSVLVIGD